MDPLTQFVVVSSNPTGHCRLQCPREGCSAEFLSTTDEALGELECPQCDFVGGYKIDIAPYVPIPHVMHKPWERAEIIKMAVMRGYRLSAIMGEIFAEIVLWTYCKNKEHGVCTIHLHSFTRQKPHNGGCKKCPRAPKKYKPPSPADHCEGEWRCARGHVWPQKPRAELLRMGGYCAKCNLHLNEEVTRASFQEFFGLPFTTAYPTWLPGLELDGYNEELGIAFEYNGIQHYKLTGVYHNNPDKLIKQQENDEKKVLACAMQGVELVIVPYTVKIQHIRRYVREQLLSLDCEPVGQMLSDEEFYSTVNSGSYNDGKYAAIEEIVTKAGGTLLSTEYIGSTTKMKVKCPTCSEIIEVTPDTIRRSYKAKGGVGCMDCGGRAKLEDDELIERAAKMGYTIHEIWYKMYGIKEYGIGKKKKSGKRMLVTCPAGHTYDVMQTNFFHGKDVEDARNEKPKKGCKICSDSTRGLGKSDRALAAYEQEMGIRLVDRKEYKDQKSLCWWKCDLHGHFIRRCKTGVKTPCMLCKVYNEGKIHQCTLLTNQLSMPGQVTISLQWQCDICQCTFDSTKQNLKAKNKIHNCLLAVPKTATKQKSIDTPSKAIVPTWLSAAGCTLVSPVYTGVDKELHWRCNANGHVFANTCKAIQKRTKDGTLPHKTCTVCDYNDAGRPYGLQVTPVPLHGKDTVLWTRDCLLCGAINIAGCHMKMKSSNHATDVRLGRSLLGRAQAHICPSPQRRSLIAARIYLFLHFALGLPIRAATYIAWLAIQ